MVDHRLGARAPGDVDPCWRALRHRGSQRCDKGWRYLVLLRRVASARRRNPMARLSAAAGLIACVMALAAALTSPAHSQAYPSQPVRIIVPNPAGGLPDTVSRIVGRRLQERWQQSVVVENRPGANGRVAVGALLNLAADGHHLLVSDGSIISINPLLYASLSYDPKDLEPIAMLARAPLFLAIHAKMPVANLREFIAYARARPGQLNYGSSGVG